MAYSEEQRRSALETFIRFDHSYADTIAELGYPNRGTLRGWWREYERTGVVPVRKSVSDPTCTDAMKRAAADYYLGHGRSLARTARALGYPKSRQLLGEWIDEYAPGQRKRRGTGPGSGPRAPGEEGAGGRGARGQDRHRGGGRRAEWRAAGRALRMAQGDHGP